MKYTLKNKAFQLTYITILFICISLFVIPTFAMSSKVYDYAELFSKEQLLDLESNIQNIYATQVLDVGIVTTNDMKGKSSMVYADDFYDEMGYGVGEDYSGLLLLINMEDREVYISTCGSAIHYFTDASLNTILDALYKDLGTGDYFSSSQIFLTKVGSILSKNILPNHYQEKQELEVLQEPTEFYTAERTAICLVVSLVITGIFCLIIRYRYKNPATPSTINYLNQNSIRYKAQRDEFLHSHISKTKRETNSSNTPKNNSNRSSTHTSSSGRSHGGGGRKF